MLLEFHQVRPVRCRQCKLGGKVGFQHWDSCHCLQQNIVDCLLVCLALVADDGWLRGVALEKFFFAFNLFVVRSREITIGEGGNIDA